MPSNPADNREAYLQLIECQPLINDRFKNIRRIDPNGGDGNFSLVFTSHDVITDKEVVLKFFDPSLNLDIDRLARFKREGEILKKLKGKPNILECIDGTCELPIGLVHESGIKIDMIFNFIPLKKANGSIEQFIYSNTLTPEKSLIYFREMCKAVARIHTLKMCHRDLRPANFLIFPNDDVRLGDFGTAKFLDGSMPDIRLKYQTRVGHFYYSAPELHCQIGISDDYSFTADIFSLGAILFEMFSKEQLMNYLYNKDFLNNIVKLSNLLAVSPEKFRIDYYLSVIDSVGSSANFPDIFSFNNSVPNSIKNHLNSLYKELSRINFTKRLVDFDTIFRRINICLLTLRNEEKYQRWLRNKKEMRALKPK